MSNITMYIKEITIEELNDNFYDKERFQGYCKECGSYDKKYSCPPFSDQVDNLLDNYNYMQLIFAKIDYTDEEIATHQGKEKALEYTKETFFPIKIYIHDKLIEMESKLTDTYFSAMGSCALCEECEKVHDRDCKYPERMRVSLEALGYDIVGMLKEYFGIEIKWANDGLPEYYTLLGGFASVDRIDVLESELVSISEGYGRS